jgi:hypothetical protein
MIEIAVWIVGAYLVACLLTRPPHAWVVRTTDGTVVPPVVSETPRSDYDGDVHPLRLLPDPRLRGWKEQSGPGSGPFSAFRRVIGRPDVLRTARWALGISAVTLLLAAACRRLRRLLPEPPAFPVELPVADIRLHDAK